MSIMFDTKRATHRAHRQASCGAAITLVAKPCEYLATFECATRCAEVLGAGGLTNVGDGIFESIPVYKIPLEDMQIACAKLSKQFSIALVDLVCHRDSTRFVPVWIIARTGPTPVTKQPVSTLDDY